MNSTLSKNLLVQIFSKGCKEKSKWKIGTEHEKFGFKKVGNQKTEGGTKEVLMMEYSL